MNIVKLSGGLGSKMFQYAFFLALAGEKKIDLHGKELETAFGISPDVVSAHELASFADVSTSLWANFRRIVLKKPLHTTGSILKESEDTFHREFLDCDNTYFSGNWRSWLYFDAIEDEIRRTYIFKQPLSAMNHACIESMRQCESVSIHIRRGDNAKKDRWKEIGSVCSLDYYNWAIAHIKEQLGDNVHYFVFSDDIAWCRTNLPLKDASYIDWNKRSEAYNDMRLMAACKHNIIANSSFSWWGAYLNTNPDKIVLSPAKWFRTKPVKDIIPQGWVQLPVD